MISTVFQAFIYNVFGNYFIFTIVFIIGTSILMMLLNIPTTMIVSIIGLSIIVLNLLYGGVVLGILAAIIALVLGIKIATAIYSLFKPNI